MVTELKRLNLHLMVSVWSKFDEQTTFFKTMAAHGEMLNGSTYYDAWSSEARERFYSFSKTSMFDAGVEALWLDATEPEGFPNVNDETALGSGNALINTYSLMTTKAIADGLRRDFPDAQGARVFSLTRSSFAGQQRTGATLWSGDTEAVWDSYRRQVAASLNYQLSGMPYWSEDIGGYFRPANEVTSADYKDLLVRWFQFGVFTPIYRVHGRHAHHLWEFGDEVLSILNSTNNLRYRLLPYTYSGFHRVEVEGFTMQRALVLDFDGMDDIADEFMWGPAFLVAPIVTQTDSAALCREVTLPEVPGGWVDFWTGARVASGRSQAAAPVEHSPIFVRPGSVVPLGPYLQHTAERPADPLEVRVFAGADGRFTLFEDDGKSRKYQSGASSTIEFVYDDATSTLTVGDRSGSFDGMLRSRTLQIVAVRPGHGTGLEPASSPDQTVTYTGSKLSIRLNAKTIV